MRSAKTIFILLVWLAVPTAVASEIQASGSFQVAFSNCVESIGVGLAPTANVAAHVPAGFIPVGSGQPVTPLVVRTSRCGGISVAGLPARAGEVVQIGAVIVPPDGTGDINNYSIWYYTSDLRLAIALRLAGVEAQFVPTIDYVVGSDSLFVRVPLPGRPRFSLSGSITPSLQPAGSFLANWWQRGYHGAPTKMSTNVPVIAIGGADLTLTTNAGGPLGELIGGSSAGFPIIQQFNSFGHAQMTVSIQ
jgi:hypothetical protein